MRQVQNKADKKGGQSVFDGCMWVPPAETGSYMERERARVRAQGNLGGKTGSVLTAATCERLCHVPAGTFSRVCTMLVEQTRTGNHTGGAAVGHVREVWATLQWGGENDVTVWFDGGDVQWLA